MTPRNTVVLALGSNLGDRLANLQAAVDALGGPASMMSRSRRSTRPRPSAVRPSRTT